MFTAFYKELNEILIENSILKQVNDRKLIPNRKIVKLMNERKIEIMKE